MLGTTIIMSFMCFFAVVSIITFHQSSKAADCSKASVVVSLIFPVMQAGIMEGGFISMG